MVDAQRKSASKYVKDQLMNNIPERSNGESALEFFTHAIGEKRTVSAGRAGKQPVRRAAVGTEAVLEDSARFYRCQLIIATHSPFLLSMAGAKIYDLDESPAAVKRWTDLESVRTYYDFSAPMRGIRPRP